MVRAGVCAQVGDSKRALKDLGRAAELGLKAEAHLGMADVLFSLHSDIDGAINHCLEALTADPMAWEACWNLAEFYRMKGGVVRAQRYQEEGLRLRQFASGELPTWERRVRERPRPAVSESDIRVRGPARMFKTCRCRSGDLEVEVEVAPVLSYSLVHCQQPVVPVLVVRNTGSAKSGPTDVRVSMPGSVRPARVHIPPLVPGAEHRVLDVPCGPNPDLLYSLPETRQVQVTVAVAGGEPEAVQIKLLAHDEWSLVQEHWGTLAAFVLPNHPLVRKVVLAAKRRLSVLTNGNYDSFYPLLQSADPGRIAAAAQAIYDCLRLDWKLHYTHEPPCFEAGSQKIRLPHDVLAEPDPGGGEGTCVDLTLLLAGCLEAVGALPAVVMTESAPGCWHTLLAGGVAVGPGDSMVMRERAALSGRLLLESMGIAQSESLPAPVRKKVALDFASAQREAWDTLARSELVFVLAVAAARREGITPLPFAGEPGQSAVVAEAIRQATKTARALVTGYVGTTHLFIGLLEADPGIAQVLRDAGIAPEAARHELLTTLGRLPVNPVEHPPSWTKNGQKTLAFASVLARHAGANEIRSEHILASLTESESRVFSRALEKMGSNREALRRAVRNRWGDLAASRLLDSISSLF